MSPWTKKLIVTVAAACVIFWAAGCQNLHRQNAQIAQARWARARATVMSQLAEQQFKSGQLDKALLTLGKALEIDPSFARLQTLRGQILAEKGQGQAALAAFEVAIAVDPASAEAHYHCGVQYERWGQFDKALARYQSATELEPASVCYAVAMAETLGHLNRLPEALALIDRTLTSQQQSVALRVTAGELCMASGDYQSASRYFRDAGRLAGDDVSVLRSLAMALYHAGRRDEARGHLEQLVNRVAPNAAARPVEPFARTSLVGSSRQPTETDEAEAGDRAELLSALGDCYLTDGQIDRASQCFQEVVRLHSRAAGPWENLSKLALYQSRWEEALSAADRAIALQADSPWARLARGYALCQLGRQAEAVTEIQRAHRLAPNDVLMLCLLADCYRQTGNAPTAREVLLRALRVAPADPLANRMLRQLAQAGSARPAEVRPMVTAGAVVSP